MIKLLRFIPLLLILLLFISVKSFNTRIARLTIDYGPRSIGIAHSNYFGIVEPYGVVRNERDQVIVANKILDLARMWSVSEIILGVPLDSNGILNYGVKNFNGQLCLNFSKVLSATSENLYPGKFKTNLFDERYTTKEAQLRLKLDKVTASLDAMSAACLLERYLEDCGEGSLSAEACSFPPPPELAHFNYDKVRRHIRSLYPSDHG